MIVETKVKDPPRPLQTERLSNGNRMLIRDLVMELEEGVFRQPPSLPMPWIPARHVVRPGDTR